MRLGIEIAEKRGVKPADRAGVDARQTRYDLPDRRSEQMYQLDEAIGAVDIQLTDDEVKAVEAAYTPHPILGHS